ncbi:chaperone protein dnaJ 20, chloroplastic-like [Vicia villosa]|uniref:chaperone protein dnaJ 20, chloroplastic-like n=1 Tax=Vicia villosa TaxID=3911 RepID=UPI00273C4E69|nr:chaperone protein dnaJ 20, chloroplastic-like [Vicia villosa]
MYCCYRITIQPNVTPISVTYSGIRSNSGKFQIRNYGSNSLLKIKASIKNNNNCASFKSELTLYEVLGISKSVSIAELKRAYKQKARKCHPDLSPPGQDKEYTKMFIIVREAYEILSDPVTKAIYDRDLAKGIPFEFSTSRHYCHRSHYDQVSEEKKKWKNGWESQLAELEKKSDGKEDKENMTWGARMRQRSTY